MELKTYRNPGNHTFTAAPISLIEVITQSDVEYFFAGQGVTDQSGHPFTILEIRQLPGQLWKVMLLPGLATRQQE